MSSSRDFAQSTGDAHVSCEARHAAPSASFFSVVFEGDLRALTFNPFTEKTRYGRPVTVGFGHAFAEFDEFCDERDALIEALRFVSTDPCFSLLGSVTRDAVRAALSDAAPQARTADAPRDEPQ
jgi:hypothetical protein